MRLVTTDTISDGPVGHGEIIHAVAVSGANVLRDMREAITNTLGGRMTRYESLIDATVQRALDQLAERARAKGYDGVLAIRISHPVITDGAVEVLVTGTGFNFIQPPV